MYTAEDMQMTDPKEYVYVLTLHNTMDISRPWRSRTTFRRTNAAAAFKSVLQVRNVPV